MTTMPPKDWAKVNENVVRAKAAIDDMRPRIAHPGDLERLRIIKLALFDLDQLQAELHALLFGLVDKASFLTARGRELAREALDRRNRIEAALDAMSKGETR